MGWAGLGPGLTEPLKTQPTTQCSEKLLGGLAGSEEGEEGPERTIRGWGMSQASLSPPVRGRPEGRGRGDWVGGAALCLRDPTGEAVSGRGWPR